LDLSALSGEAELDYTEYYSEGRKKFVDPLKNIEVREEWNAGETLFYSIIENRVLWASRRSRRRGSEKIGCAVDRGLEMMEYGSVGMMG